MIKDGPHITYRKNEIFQNYYIIDTNGRKQSDQKKLEIGSGEIILENPVEQIPYIKIKKNILKYPEEYQEVSRILALGDIHGDFNLLFQFLINCKVIDENLNWIFGDGHLVFCGDIFDRGEKVTECLWLIYHLENESLKNGGQVHYLLGNHEIMSMDGDTRYLSNKYDTLCMNFRLSYKDLFNEETELGRWLRRKNTVIKINDYIFIHAGISPKLKNYKLSLAGINQRVRNYLEGDEDLFYFVNDVWSPIWYRGYLMNWQGMGSIREDQVKDILSFYQAKSIVFAHTNVETVERLFDGKLYAIDIPFAKDNPSQALLIEHDKPYTVSFQGEKSEV